MASEELIERQYSKLEWLFYIILLPLLFTALLTGILLSFLGYDVISSVKNAANRIPIIEKLVPDPPKPGSVEAMQPEEMKQDILKLTNQLGAKELDVKKLSLNVQDKDQMIQTLQNNIDSLKKQMEEKRASDEEHQQKLNELSQVYAKMSPSKAAPIIENLSVDEAVLVMSGMKADDRSNIFAKMDPKKAADISIQLKDVIPTKDLEISALQERIKLLNEQLSAQKVKGLNKSELAATFAGMQPSNAAEVLVQMYSASPSQVIQVMSSMDKNAMSKIMDAMSQKYADIASKIAGSLIKP